MIRGRKFFGDSLSSIEVFGIFWQETPQRSIELLMNKLFLLAFSLVSISVAFDVRAEEHMQCAFGVDLLKQRENGASIQSKQLGTELVSLTEVKKTSRNDRYGKKDGNMQLIMDVREGGMIGLELKVLRTNVHAAIEFTEKQLKSDRILLAVHNFAPVGSAEIVSSEVATRFWVDCSSI